MDNNHYLYFCICALQISRHDSEREYDSLPLSPTVSIICQSAHKKMGKDGSGN